MANYIVSNAKFKPFSYAELVAPIKEYTEVYDKLGDTYASLSEQTEAFKNEINQSSSPEAFQLYSQYSKSLNDAIDNFTTKGLTHSSKADLLKMKREYNKYITPIAKASEAMKEANAMRDKAGPDAIFEVSRYNSLDDLMGGKTANNRYQSASALTKKTAAITEAVMKEALQDPEIKKVLGTQQYMMTQHTGGSYEDLLAAITNNPKIQNKFTEIKKQVMKETGYENYDAYGKVAIENAVNTGLYAGLDNPVKQFKENRGFITPELQERQRQFNIGLKIKGYDEDGNIDSENSYWKLPKDASSGDRVPVYNDIITVSRDGTRKVGLATGESIKGRKVKIDVEKGTYSIKIGNLILGTYNPKTETFTSGIDRNKRKEESVTKILGHTYDNDVDDLNVQRLLEEIANVANKTGDNSLNNYNFYIDLDNAEGSSDDGGYSIEPLYRGMLTSFDSSDGGVNKNIY